MPRWVRLGAWALSGAAVLFIAIVAVSYLVVMRRAKLVPPDPTPAPVALLRAPIAPGPNAAVLERGRYLTVSGDCVSCHMRLGGKPFEGGLGLKTPFGVIFSANITGDRSHGIGDWSPDDFWRMMSGGLGRHAKFIYPAMPYNYYTRISRPDSDAILSFLKTVPASHYRPPANLLPVPMNIRPVLIGWNVMFLKNRRFSPDPAHDAAWNRGALLVEGLGHCGACHTPMNLAGAPETSRYLRGAVLNGWLAPDLTGNPRTGLGRWSPADVATYLRAGRNAHSNAAGPMGEVVAYQTSLMSDADLMAIATYLKSLPPSPEARTTPPDPGAMRRGAAIYADACAGCHLPGGRGQAGLFPPLPGDAVAQQADPTGLVRIVLAGARTGPTPSRPSAPTMPSFAWKLTDPEVADVATYVRNAWGNHASSVTAQEAATGRRAGKLAAALRPFPTGDSR